MTRVEQLERVAAAAQRVVTGTFQANPDRTTWIVDEAALGALQEELLALAAHPK